MNFINIKLFGHEIEGYFNNKKTAKVRLTAVGSNGNLWKAVKITKNLRSRDHGSSDGRAGGSRSQGREFKPRLVPHEIIFFKLKSY